MIIKMGEKIDIQLMFETKKKEILQYVAEGIKAQEISETVYTIIDNFKNDITEENYQDILAGFFVHSEWMKIALKEFLKISNRPLNRCHTNSLPFFGKELLSLFDNDSLSTLMQNQILELKCGPTEVRLKVDRRKAFNLGEEGKCDNDGTISIFGQMY